MIKDQVIKNHFQNHLHSIHLFNSFNPLTYSIIIIIIIIIIGYPQHNDNNFIRKDTNLFEDKHCQDSDRYIASGVFTITTNQLPQSLTQTQTQRYNMQSDTLHNNEQSFKRFEGYGGGVSGGDTILNSHSLQKTVNPRFNGATNHVRNSWNKNDRKFKKNTKLDGNRVDPNAPHLMKLNRLYQYNILKKNDIVN